MVQLLKLDQCDLWLSKFSLEVYLTALSKVASRITSGAHPSFLACSHLIAQRHQWSPASKPGKLYLGSGVIRSLPYAFVPSRNSYVILAQTTCVPLSSLPVVQKPSL